MDRTAGLDILSGQGRRLREEFDLPWSEQTQQVACALRFMGPAKKEAGSSRRDSGPTQVVGIVGGASSGKSTVFNNLLGGRRFSLVTIKSHATRGVILAGHACHEMALESWLYHQRVLLPGLAARPAERCEDLQGEPDTAVVLYHEQDDLRDVLLVDTPDFTSNAAEQEGDVTLSMLPWFDRLIVVVDHERWFDRQIVDELGNAASRFGQQRMVVFNRTTQGELGDADRRRLEEQSRQLNAESTTILNYQPGRGFRRFDPQVVRNMVEAVRRPVPDRSAALQRELTGRMAAVLAVNSRRAKGLDVLRRTLARSAERMSPASWWECVTAMMTPEERHRLDGFSRLVGLSQMRDWLDRQRRRIEQGMARVPWLRLPATPRADGATLPAEAFSREQSGLDYFEAHCERQLRQLNEETAGSDFWAELRRTANRQPARLDAAFTETLRPRVRQCVADLAAALQAWDAKVQHECQSMSPHVVGSLSMAMIGVAAILVAVPGPISALTPVIAAGAIKAGLVKIGAAGVFGAFGGRSVARLVEIVREKLLASPEFNQVRAAAETCRSLLDEHARAAAAELEQAARKLTLLKGEPLLEALESSL